MNTFFFSDASGAIDLKIFKELNGYDQKILPTNEDMYFAYKLITNGYSIGYCAESIVEHSHNLSFNEQYKRYYNTGVFFKHNKYLDKYKTDSSGFDLALYVLKRILEEKNWNALLKFIPNMAARYLGMKVGKI
ncbi:MAG: hypothetical protein LUF86_04545 [Clostridiales bacterium]|nr:hypothetical protein [Clostridiales bacterium]